MASHQVHIGLLGPFEVTIDGRPVGPAGGRRRSLLALLALEAGSVVPVPTIVDRVWGENAPASAANLVQTYVSTWRKALAAGSLGRSRPEGATDLLATVGSGYRLSLGRDECDLVAYREDAERGRAAERSGDQGGASAAFAAALAHWRGDPLVDLVGEPLHHRVAEALHRERLTTTEAWARTTLAAGLDPRAVASVLAEARRDEPWREELTELLMWALTASGRQSEALEAFAATRELLADELGADPGPALSTMHTRVLRGDPDLLLAGPTTPPGRQAPVSTSPPVRPSRTTTLVGRGAEIAAVQELVRTHRLVTVVGPGGSGKSRVATEVLDAWREAARDGWWLELASLADDERVAATIAAALGIQVTSEVDAEVALARHFADADALLVFDNAEHLSRVPGLVDRLHAATRGLRLLVTSREPLRLAEEQQYHLPLLDEASSVRLLVERARRHDPAYDIDASNSAALAELATLLDGLPLALEMAASWLRLMGAEALVAHLRTNGLDVSARTAGSPARHRSVRDSIAWSVDLLEPAERRLLCELSVFAGPFTLASATAVCAEGGVEEGTDVVDSVFDLVDSSLVHVVPSLSDGPRLRLLQAVREFAASRATEEGVDVDALRDRHASRMRTWAVELARHSEGPQSPTWLSRAVAEADDLRRAMEHLARTGAADDHLQLVVDAMVLWFEAGMEREGLERLSAALDEAGGSAAARAIGLTYWAWLRAGSHRGEAAAAAREGLTLARAVGDVPVEAFALQTLGETADGAEADEASHGVFDAADRAEAMPVRYGPTAPDAVRCGASYNLAARAMYRYAPDAVAWQEEALRRAEREADPRITAVNVARLALVRLLTGDVGAARDLVSRSRPAVSTLVAARWEDIVTYAEAMLARYEGLTTTADALLTGLWRATSTSGRTLHAVLGAVALAEIRCQDGAYEEADRLLHEAERLVGTTTDPVHLTRIMTRQARVRRLRGDLTGAGSLLAQIAGTLSRDELTPERTIWLLEAAEAARHTGDEDQVTRLLTELDDAVRRTGLTLSPWDRTHAAALRS